jgi:hypothetical protein
MCKKELATPLGSFALSFVAFASLSVSTHSFVTLV